MQTLSHAKHWIWLTLKTKLAGVWVSAGWYTLSSVEQHNPEQVSDSVGSVPGTPSSHTLTAVDDVQDSPSSDELELASATELSHTEVFVSECCERFRALHHERSLVCRRFMLQHCVLCTHPFLCTAQDCPVPCMMVSCTIRGARALWDYLWACSGTSAPPVSLPLFSGFRLISHFFLKIPLYEMQKQPWYETNCIYAPIHTSFHNSTVTSTTYSPNHDVYGYRLFSHSYWENGPELVEWITVTHIFFNDTTLRFFAKDSWNYLSGKG